MDLQWYTLLLQKKISSDIMNKSDDKWIQNTRRNEMNGTPSRTERKGTKSRRRHETALVGAKIYEL